MNLDQLFFKYCMYYPTVLLQGEKVPQHLRNFRKTQWASSNDLAELQERKLRALVAHAKLRIPHYQRALRGIDVKPAFGLEDLRNLPFVSKRDLQMAQVEFTEPGTQSTLKRKTTGGTTGQPVFVWKTADAIAQENAANWRGFEWAGIDIGHRQGRFWGLPLARRSRLRAHTADFIVNRRRCSAFSFNESDMGRYTKRLNRFAPHYFYGYVSMLTAYAEYLSCSKERLKFNLQAVVPTAEVLTPYHRKLFTQFFGAPVFNEYGCGELGTIAHECEKGSMHINSENLIVEILRANEPCAPGEIGEVVVTELNNTGMPLLRYRLGDFASFADVPCSCGRGLPVIENIAGRALDIIYNREGKMFHGMFFLYVFQEVKRRNLGITAFQVVQNDLEHLVMKVVVNARYGSETERLVRKLIQEAFGEYVQVAFDKVEAIPRERSGKMRLVVGMPSTTPSVTPRSEA